MFFQKIDEWLITRIFEPFAWQTEYRFGLTGLKLYLYLYMISFTALGLNAYNNGFYLFTFFDVILITGQIFFAPRAEARLRRSGGLNQNKMQWPIRTMGCMFMGFMVVLDIFVLSTYTPNDALADFGIFTLLLALYFGSCNTLPPGYEERKFVPRTI